MFRLAFVLTAVVTFATPAVQAHSKVCPAEKDSIGAQWMAGEHLYLADRGFSAACKRLGVAHKYCHGSKVPRKDKMVSLSYGQLNVLGDFYLKEDTAFEEEGDTEISDDGLKAIFKCIDKEGKVHEEQREKPEVRYPGCTWVFFTNSNSMIKTVTSNINHFGWHNMKAYVRIHGKALEYAKRAGELARAGKVRKSDYHLRKALYLNGFADHFLTDAFPAGHIRVPRKELKKWGRKNLGGFFKRYKGDILSMVLHNNEAKNQIGKEVGMLVENSLGDRWETRSDSKLNECRQENHIGVRLPAEAVTYSVMELWQAYETGVLPAGIYGAAYLVPFATDDGLSAKLNAKMFEEGRETLARRYHKKLGKPLNWLISQDNIMLMVERMDQIMSKFRKHVRRDLAEDLNLRKRLPGAYIEAYAHAR